MAGDVYSEPPHTGRGGWTWYTGSAAWLYRVGLENDPRLPAAWEPADAGAVRPGGLGGL